MNEVKDLAALVRAGTPLITIETTEEPRVVELFRHVLGEVLRPLYQWSITTGLRRLDIEQSEEDTGTDVTSLLRRLASLDGRSVVLLLDLQPFLGYAGHQRMLRELVQGSIGPGHTLVLVGAKLELPAELEAEGVRFSLQLPDAKALRRMVRDELALYEREHAGRRVRVDAEAEAALFRQLGGLTLADARKLVRHLIHDDGVLDAADLPRLGKLKFDLLNRSGTLHFEFDTARFAEVAGLRRLKHWVQLRAGAMRGEPMPPGFDPPRGVLLLGVQGCGKSLAAKAVAGGFGLPLMRLDFGALYNKYHGETERNLREALASAEQLAPCVLWMDEIEKGLAGSDSDGGVSRRVLGTFLTWMAERKAPVFLVATANAVEQLPPELLRKGRFDEIFFVDLPTESVRAEILQLHLDRRRVDWSGFSLQTLAAASSGFSGAEIEQAVVSALYAAHAQRLTLSESHLLEEIQRTRPLSILMAEKVEALRRWAADRTVPAD